MTFVTWGLSKSPEIIHKFLLLACAACTCKKKRPAFAYSVYNSQAKVECCKPFRVNGQGLELRQIRTAWGSNRQKRVFFSQTFPRSQPISLFVEIVPCPPHMWSSTSQMRARQGALWGFTVVFTRAATHPGPSPSAAWYQNVQEDHHPSRHFLQRSPSGTGLRVLGSRAPQQASVAGFGFERRHERFQRGNPSWHTAL